MTADEQPTPNPFAERFGSLPVGDMAPVDDDLRALVPKGSFIDVLGIELLEVGPGAARATMAVEGLHLNQAGACQGGALVALADAVAGWGAKAALSPGSSFTTIALTMNLLRAGREGDVLLATATPTHLGRTSMVLTVDVALHTGGQSGKLVATFGCTQLVLR